ncbi:head completion/stabilization protein [Alloalcanivorax xenomutans]|uniref:head completion/stabilization protein n=1 Tax=Alloalcanivorax xenomutans TaxID=1094342 RepID=UPI003BAB5989
MSLVASGNGESGASAALTSGPFWPEIVPSHFRETMRQDTTVPAARLQEVLAGAIAEVNDRLSTWAGRQFAETLAEVAAEKINGESVKVLSYRLAVYALAKALLVERYRDYDSTQSAHQRADEMDETVDDYRRDAAWNIARIIDRPRSVVELI